MTPAGKKVFLPYLRADQEHVRPLIEMVRRLGYQILFDDELQGGQEWWDTILGQIRECDFMLLAVSENALRSDASMAEFRYARSLNKPILPVMVDRVLPTLLWPDIYALQPVDYTGTPDETALELVAALARLPAAGTLQTPLPEPPPFPISYEQLGITGLSDLVQLGRDALGTILEGRRDSDGTLVGVRLIERLDDRQRELLEALPSRLPIHPNLLTVHSTGTAANGSTYLVTERRSGEILAYRRSRSVTLSPREAYSLLGALLPALEALHGVGGVHGSISPTTVLRQGTRWLLTDAGIAPIVVPLPPPADRPLDDLLLHVATEVLGGEPCSPAADLFGLAATVDELVTGRLPRPGLPAESVGAYADRLKTVPHPVVAELSIRRLSARRPQPDDLPPNLASILIHALDPRPERRRLKVPPEWVGASPTVAELPQGGPSGANHILQWPQDASAPSPARAEPQSPPSSPADLDRHLENVVDDDVQFTVYKPTSLQVGRWELMLAVAHKSEQFIGEQGKVVNPFTEVASLATARLGDLSGHKTLVTDSSLGLQRGSELSFVPEADGIVFNPPRASFLWLEPVHVEEFRLRADARMAGKYARGYLSVFYGLLLIAEVNLSIRVSRPDDEITTAADEARNPGTGAVGWDAARRYRTIFASYSHRDAGVVDWFEQTHRSIGDELLRDIRHIRSGEVWDQRLQSMIRESDLFQLFWSSNSRQSDFVRNEWEYALDLQRDRFIRPVYWERPMPPPPDELGHVHFTFFDGSAVAAPTIGGLPELPASAAPTAEGPVGFASYLTVLSERLQAPNLTRDDQREVVAELKVGLARPGDRNAVLHLIQQMKGRSDLDAEIAQELDAMIRPQAPLTPPGSRLRDRVSRKPRVTMLQISDFLDRAIEAADRCGYAAIVVVIDRDESRQTTLVNQLASDSKSLYGITGKDMLIVIPAPTSGHVQSIMNIRDPEKYWDEYSTPASFFFGLQGASSHAFSQAFWEVSGEPERTRGIRVDESGRAPFWPSDATVTVAQRARLTQALQAIVTPAVSESARFFGLDDGWVPSVCLLSLRDRTLFVLGRKLDDEIYGFFRRVMERTPGTITGLWLSQAVATVVQQLNLRLAESPAELGGTLAGWTCRCYRDDLQVSLS